MHILLLAENPGDRQLLDKTLKDEGLACQVTHASSKEEFQAALKQTQFDLIISDLALPAYSGIAALAASKKLQPDTPFIFVSGAKGEEQIAESLKSGAVDYVLKEDRPHRLGPVARRALHRCSRRRLAESCSQERTAIRRHASRARRCQEGGQPSWWRGADLTSMESIQDSPLVDAFLAPRILRLRFVRVASFASLTAQRSLRSAQDARQ